MEINEALKIIRRNLRKNAVESRHFKAQCRERGIDTATVKEKAKKGRINGIIEQGEGIYKVMFEHEKNKD